MPHDTKKSHLILFLLILVSAAVAGAGWLYYQSQARQNEEAPEDSPLVMKKLLDNRPVSLTDSNDRDFVWFFTDEARLFRLSSMGELTEMPLPSLSGTFLKAVWPKEGSDFLAQAAQVGKNSLFYYDSAQSKYNTLDGSITNPAWAGTGKQIVFVWKSKDGKSQQLVISNPDGSGYRSLTELPWPDFDIYPSPSNNFALLIRSHLNGKINKIYRFSLDDGSYESIVSEGANTYALWSPKGEGFAYLQDGKLMYYDTQSKSSRDLHVWTSRNKVAFDPQGRYLYAAVRKEGGVGDKFIRIEILSSEQIDYHVPKEDIMADNLVISGGLLYFSDSVNGGLYSVGK